MSGIEHFDRSGAPITLARWTELSEDQSYRYVERTWVHGFEHEVVTLWNGFDPYRLNFTDGPPLIFIVSELRTNGAKVDVHEHHLVATEAEASAAHHALVKHLRLLRQRVAGAVH